MQIVNTAACKIDDTFRVDRLPRRYSIFHQAIQTYSNRFIVIIVKEFLCGVESKIKFFPLFAIVGLFDDKA